MLNFNYDIGTKIFFGEGQVAKLPVEICEYTNQLLLVYGGGSIKKNGIYDTVVDLLKRYGISFVELAGVEPNPRIETVERGIALCREHGLGGILAIGGGSSIDCAKAIAGGVFIDTDAWTMVKNPQLIQKALPVFSILTLAATGSEMDNCGVISNMKTKEKIGLKHPLLLPKASVLDPTYTFSVPPYHTAAGTADIMSHTFENYFSIHTGGYLQDRMAEGILKTCIHYGPIAVENGNDYEARANLMWSSSLAINGLIALGKSCPWSVHSMEHQLSAYYDLTHGVGLAILTPAWMRYILSERTVDKFVEYGVNVWDIDRNLDKMSIAKLAIEKTQDFFVKELKIPATLREVGIDETYFDEMAEHAATASLLKAFVPLSKEDVKKIYQMCL